MEDYSSIGRYYRSKTFIAAVGLSMCALKKITRPVS